MIHHLQSTLARLEEILDGSIAAMTAREAVDHSAIATQKGRALLALSRLPQRIAADAMPEDVRAAVTRVREKLATENALLERRLEASELVVALIGEAVLATDWDGTYGPDQLSRVARSTAASS